MVGIAVRVIADDAIKMVQAVSKETKGSALLKAIGARQVKWIADNFDADGALGGRPWQRLSASTVYGRRKGSDKILRDTGRLRMSFINGNPLSITDTSVTVGTNMEFASFHEYGTKPYTIFAPNAVKKVTVKSKKGKVFTRIQPLMLAFPHPAGNVTFTQGAWRGKTGFFARKINHPGLPPRPMLPPIPIAIQLAADVVTAAVTRAVQRTKTR